MSSTSKTGTTTTTTTTKTMMTMRASTKRTIPTAGVTMKPVMWVAGKDGVHDNDDGVDDKYDDSGNNER